MLWVVLRMFSWIQNKDGNQKSSWELIGEEAYGKSSFDNVPEWVLKELNHLQTKYSWHDAASEGRYFILKGKHFKYKITPAGQGGPITYIHRKPRVKH